MIKSLVCARKEMSTYEILASNVDMRMAVRFCVQDFSREDMGSGVESEMRGGNLGTLPL